MKAILEVGCYRWAISPEEALKVIRALKKGTPVERDSHHPKAYNGGGRWVKDPERPGSVEMSIVDDDDISSVAMPEVLPAEPALKAPRIAKQLNFHGNSAVE